MNETDKLYQEYLSKFYILFKQMLANENWQSTPLLKLYHSKLAKLAEEYAASAHILENNAPVEVSKPEEDRHAIFQAKNMQLVYIYLYTSDGKSLDAWGRLVYNLPRNYISRPIYEDEYDVQSAALITPILSNAGYAAVWVDKDAIIRLTEEGEEIKDKLGRPLLTLKDKAVNMQNMEFFWNNFMLYDWKNGALKFSKNAEKIIK
jgi:intracellular multiplication protein IcmQ